MRRRRFLAGLGAVAVAAVAGGTAVAARDDGGGGGAAPPKRATSTAKVTRTDLVTREDLDGTLGYGDTSDLAVARAGTITALPQPGAIIGRGGSLVEVDGEPVPLLLGDKPLWRPLYRGVEGPDVRILEENLVALGHGAGLTVDEKFTAATERAVKAWQDALGVDDTGILINDRVVVRTGPVRIAARVAEVGAPAGGPALKVTSPDQRVSVALEASSQGLVKVGDAVKVTLPDDTTLPGKVATVGTTVTPGDDQAGTSASIAVTVALDDPKAAAGLDEAPVQVSVVQSQATDVLAVPIQALLALAEGGYGVQKQVGSRSPLVAVKLGASADGLVEVTGDLAEGDRVVVPA
ncbi:MAG: peptidoglycan-binding protein [Acidimicrobiales bacterium]|nr:peptidoglycan-binding protein [Acidimicrobiales bacterium]